MKKWQKSLICGVCAVATFTLSGCSQLAEVFENSTSESVVEEEGVDSTFFEGDFKEVSVEEVESFLATAGDCSVEELLKNNSGLKCTTTGKGLEYTSNKSEFDYHGTWEEELLVMCNEERAQYCCVVEDKLINSSTYTSKDSMNCYIADGYSYWFLEEFDSETQKEDKVKQKEKYDNFTTAIIGAIKGNFDYYEFEDAYDSLIYNRKLYMATSTNGYRIKLSGFSDEKNYYSSTIIWVYDFDKKFIAASIKDTLFQRYEEEDDDGNTIILTTDATADTLILPWAGTITPPSDLDSYTLKE